MALMGFAGVSVDVGFLEYRQQAQQAATDAAAMGGVQQLIRSNCGNGIAAQTAADNDAATNGFPNAGSVAVNAAWPPATGPYANNNCAISVQITTSGVATFFSRLFGYPNGMNESTQAVGVVSWSNTACIYLLNPTQTTDFSNSNIDAPTCSIYINNASSNMSTSTIDAASISYSGATPNESGATFLEATPAPAVPIADPCPELPGCEYLANNPPSTSPCSSGGTYNNVSLQQGCYNSLTLTGTDTLSGTYVINGQFHMNNATVTGSNVTIYMTSNVSDTNFSHANLTLSAPTTGNTQGVLFYRVPSQTSALDLSTCTCALTGLLYFPKTQVNYSSTGDYYTILVFGNANFSTSQATDFANPPVGQALVPRATLAQ